MNRTIQYVKWLLLTLFAKGKSLWKKIWTSSFQKNELLEASPESSDNINAQKYHSIFDSITSTSELLVSEQVWNKIQSSLPTQRYLIPNPDIINHLKTMSSDSFNHLFPKSNPTPHLFVDPVIWNRITNSLPQSYELPNPVLETISKPMTGKYYDGLFSPSLESSNKIFVDHTIWEPIKKNLPSSYSLPIPLSKLHSKSVMGNSYYPFSSKEIAKEFKSETQIREKILKSLPKNYKIPHVELTELPSVDKFNKTDK